MSKHTWREINPHIPKHDVAIIRPLMCEACRSKRWHIVPDFNHKVSLSIICANCGKVPDVKYAEIQIDGPHIGLKPRGWTG